MKVVVPRTLPSLLEDSQRRVPVNQARFVGPNGKAYLELAPIAFIERLNESSFSEITNDFCRAMKSHKLMKNTHDLITYAPRQMGFHPIVQNIDGSIFFLCRWRSHRNHTEAVISDYCRKSGIRLGWYEPETQQVVGIQGLQLNQCRLVSDDVFANPAPELDQVDICAEACKILRKRTSQKIELKQSRH